MPGNMNVDEAKQVLMSLSRLEENIKNLNTKVDAFAKVSELVVQTDQSVKSAHNRLDDLKKDFAEKMAEQKEDYEEKLQVQKEIIVELKGNLKWLWRSVGAGAISFIFGLALFYFTKGGN